MKQLELETKEVLYTLRGVFTVLKDKELVKTRDFDDWINSARFRELNLQPRNFRSCETKIETNNGGYKMVGDYEIDTTTFELIISHYSNQVKEGLISNNDNFKDFYNNPVALMQRANELLSDKVVVLENRLAEVEPKAALMDLREANSKNTYGFLELYRSIKSTVKSDVLETNQVFKNWLTNKNFIFYKDDKIVATSWAISNDYCRMIECGRRNDVAVIEKQCKFTEHGYNAILRRLNR